MLIRSVPEEDLEALREEAEARRQSLQAYMLELIHERAAARRNRRHLDLIAERLKSSPPVVCSVDDLLTAKDAPRQGAT